MVRIPKEVPMTRLPLALSIATALAVPAAADVVHLKDGRTLEGKAETKDGQVLLRTIHGTAILDQAQVERVEPKAHLLDEYAAKAAGVAADDAEGQLGLAQWCQAHDWASQARAHAARVVEADPHHVAAREILGHILVDGRWLPKADALRAQGLAEWKGEWLPIEDAKQRAAADTQAVRQAKLQGTVNQLVSRMAYPDTEGRKACHEALSRLATAEKIPGLKEAADKTLAYYERVAPVRTSASRGVVITELRLQNATLKRPIPKINTNLGQAQSTPVTIQLPELSIVGVQTTVAIPFGLDGD